MNDISLNGRRATLMIQRFLVEMGLSPHEQRYPDRTVFTVAFDGPADRGVAQIVENAERFVFHFIFSGCVPVQRRPEVAEFIIRANWRLIEGDFQLDFDSGAVRFKVGIDFSSVELGEALVRNAILSGMDTIEMHASGLAAVAEGRLGPGAAYEAIAQKHKE